MKAINKDDLIIVLNAIKDRSTLDLDDLETILDRFGDEYFIEDGEFVKSTENQEMTAVRNVEEFRPASKIIAEQEEHIKGLRKNVDDLLYELEKQRVKITELKHEIKDKNKRIDALKTSLDRVSPDPIEIYGG